MLFGFFIYRSASNLFRRLSMRVYIILFFWQNVLHKMEILLAICTMFQKLRDPPPINIFNPVKFQESNYSSQLFDLSLLKDI